MFSYFKVYAFLNVLKHTHTTQTLLYERFTSYIVLLSFQRGSSGSDWCLELFWKLSVCEKFL